MTHVQPLTPGGDTRAQVTPNWEKHPALWGGKTTKNIVIVLIGGQPNRDIV